MAASSCFLFIVLDINLFVNVFSAIEARPHTSKAVRLARLRSRAGTKVARRSACQTDSRREVCSVCAFAFCGSWFFLTRSGLSVAGSAFSLEDSLGHAVPTTTAKVASNMWKSHSASRIGTTAKTPYPDIDRSKTIVTDPRFRR